MSEEVSQTLQTVGRLLLDWVIHSGMEPQPDGIGLFAAKDGVPEYGWIMLDFFPEEWERDEHDKAHPLLADFYIKVVHNWDAGEVPPLVVLQTQNVDEDAVVYRAVAGTAPDDVLETARRLFEDARRHGFYLRKWPEEDNNSRLSLHEGDAPC